MINPSASKGSRTVLRVCLSFLVLTLAVALRSDSGLPQQDQQIQIEKGKIFQDAYPVISETDLNCTLFILDGELPDLRITASERGEEKILLSDADVVYLNKGKKEGLEVGQIFMAVEVGARLKDYGYLAQRRGRIQVTFLEEDRAVARIDKACGRVMVGNILMPFEEKEGMLGKDLGAEPYSSIGSGPVGNVIYLQDDFNEIGSHHWAIIDMGKEQGLQVGQQMLIFRRVQPDMPRNVLGSLIVIDTQSKTSTVKILSANDAIRIGYQVQGR
jgi:hypothetical protein